MRTAELQSRLTAARSHDEWVALVAAELAAHELVFGHGTDNASDEAFWLIRHVQGYDDAAWAAAPQAAFAPRVAELAGRRIEERRPLAYLLGEAWFAGLRFSVDERVLVPRSPLAEVIEQGFAPWCDLRRGDRVLDIGTGSGCMGIAAAVHWPELDVDATDVSAGALAVARDNVARHGVAERVRLFEADVYPPGGRGYRVIMSNPPYVADAEVASLPPEYRAEPALALRAGRVGLDVADRILRGAASRLAPDGVLFLEVGGSADAFADAYPRLPVIWLDFERGGDGVLVVTADDLVQFLDIDV